MKSFSVSIQRKAVAGILDGILEWVEGGGGR